MDGVLKNSGHWSGFIVSSPWSQIKRVIYLRGRAATALWFTTVMAPPAAGRASDPDVSFCPTQQLAGTKGEELCPQGWLLH